MHATGTLMDEHQTILRVLASLEFLLSDARNRDEPVETFAAIVKFLRNYADALHHGKEEAVLFPAMESYGVSAAHGPTAVMRAEHDEGRALVRRMAQVCEAEGEPWKELRDPGLAFVSLLRAHIGKEDRILFPMAERILPQFELDRLAEEYGRVESSNFAPNVHSSYETWARELARRLGVDSDRYAAMPTCHG